MSRRDLYSSLLLLAAVLVLYAPVRHHGFSAFDDPKYVGEERVKQGLTLGGAKWALTTTTFANWHPVTWLSLMADAEMFGDYTGGHHLTSAFIHAVNGVLLFTVLRTMTGASAAPLAVAAIWALHPLRVESVAWAAERKDLLCGAFFLLSLIAYARYVRRKSWSAYAACLTLYVLGLMSKPMIVTMPFLLVLLDCWPLRRSAARKTLVIEKVPFLVFAMASCAVTIWAQHKGGAVQDVGGYPIALRLANSVWAVARYVGFTFWPVDLAVHYPYYGVLPGTHVPSSGVLAGTLLLIGATACGVWLWRRRDERSVLVGWFWFLGMLVPVIGLLQVGSQSIADRYTYLPQIGLLVAIVWGATRLMHERVTWQRPLAACAAVATVALAGRTSVQIGYWKDDVTLFTRAAEVTQRNNIAHDILGLAYSERGDLPRSIEHYRLAMEYKPAQPQHHYNLARVYWEAGDAASARREYEEAIRLKPDYPDALVNLAELSSRQGRRDEAIALYRKAIAAQGDHYIAVYNLAVELAETGRTAEAVPYFERCIALRPNLPHPYLALAIAQQELGRTADAIASLRTAQSHATERNDQSALQQINARLDSIARGAATRPATLPANPAETRAQAAGGLPASRPLSNPSAFPHNQTR